MKYIEQKIMFPGGRVVKAEVMPDGGCLFTIEMNTADDTSYNQREGIFKLVPASQLSLKDGWMKYQPKTKAEWGFRNLVKTAIKSGLKDFWRPVCDPSFDSNGRICYAPGNKPAVGKDYNWWAKTAKEFETEQGSRLGTKNEYIAFLAVLIKNLVASGWKVADAWNAVCNDSKELGHYCNSQNGKHAFEDTGSREICGFFDLANTYKILAKDEEVGGFWCVGGHCDNFSASSPLADLYHCRNFDNINLNSCGWLVLDSCPDC